MCTHSVWVSANKSKFYLHNHHTLHHWICLSWEALPARLLIPFISRHTGDIPVSESTLLKGKKKKQYYILTSVHLYNSLDKSNVKHYFYTVSISKLQAWSGDQVLLLSVNILCLIKHLKSAQASFKLFLLLPKYSFTNLLFKWQLPTGLSAGGENLQSIIHNRICNHYY